VLTQQRVRVTRELLGRLPRLRFISQTGHNLYHLDLAACAERGILISAGAPASKSPYSRTAELAWGLIIASLRHLPYEVARLKATSHLGYVERDTLEAMYAVAVDQLLAYAAGQPINVVSG
jgi:D-3-phosphoglycerate dehydrogenase / 2-oxoglutarate reductase